MIYIKRGVEMELDTKQKVLIAIYTEYQNDIPNMTKAITFKELGLESDIFKIAIDKLQNEGFIKGATIHYDGNTYLPSVANVSNVKMTRYGIEYVEEKLDITRTMNGKEKTETVFKRLTSSGLEHLKDLAAKTLAEMAKQP